MTAYDHNFDDDIHLSNKWCEKHERSLYRRDCDNFGCDNGFYYPYEDDPLWYDPDDVERCSECRGRGYFEWCPDCAEVFANEVAK